jgi:hypothetical protein
MAATTETVTYSTVAALALDKLSDKIADVISTGNAAFYYYKKRGNWNGVSSGGRQLRKSVLYQLQTVRPLGSFGTVNVNPVDSHTSAYYTWTQTAVPVSFSDLEEFQTDGSESILSIVKAKYQQAKASIDDFMSRSLLRGQGDIDGSSFTTAITSTVDGSTFVDPLTKLIAYDPTASLTVGGIDQSSNTWWRNQTTNSAATTLTAFLAELRIAHTNCQKGGGGRDKAPDLHICEQRTFNVYERALALQHRNPDYNKADIPFDNIVFKNAPLVWDEYAVDVDNGSTTVTDGSWWMLNTAFMGFDYDKKKSFKLGPQVRPNNQLVTTSLMPVRGAHWTNNRRKLGVVGDINVANVATLETATT